MKRVVLLVLAVLAAGCAGDASRPSITFHVPELMLGAEHPVLVLEIDYAPGREPSKFALEALLSTLENVTDKEAIEVRSTQLPDEPRFRESRDWAGTSYALHEEFFDSAPAGTFASGRYAYIHILFLNGFDGTAYGVAGANDIRMFPDNYRDMDHTRHPQIFIPNPDADVAERAILIHEVGHVLGLVNNGAPMLRERDDGTSHSTNPKSVMKAHTDATGAVFDRVLPDYDAAPFEFDADDLADLAAVRETVRARLAAAQERG